MFLMFDSSINEAIIVIFTFFHIKKKQTKNDKLLKQESGFSIPTPPNCLVNSLLLLLFLSLSLALCCHQYLYWHHIHRIIIKEEEK